MEQEDKSILQLQKEIDLLQKENEAFLHNEKMFHALVESAVGDIGEAFFTNIVSRLSEWLNAECVIIGLKVADNRVEGFPMYLDGKIVKGFSYNLQGTPCDFTSQRGYCVYEENVRQYFPTSKDIKTLNIQGYVGIALYDKSGEPNGILCAMSRKKLNLPPQAEEILRIVGARITSEIERIKAQKALEISELKLRTANASKDRLFTIIAHDLKSPFNSLIGFSRLLLDNIQKQRYEKVEKYVGIIHDVSLQTHTLLSNLLEWSILQTNNITFDPGVFNLTVLFNEILEFHRNLAEQKKITLTAAATNYIEVYADRNMVTIILRNLVSNAIKYTSPGGKISLSGKQDKENTTIVVSDTGVGIPEDNLDKLFRIESSFSTSGTTNEKGTGLGLILCKELVERHKGRIWADSKPGAGSDFIFVLPNFLEKKDG
jgi:signal transduction histidine kinase